MIDWNVLCWTLVFVAAMPAAELLIDLIRITVLLIREDCKYKAFYKPIATS